MESFKVLFERRIRYIVAAGALLFATIVPALVSAAQVTGRSIALSSSTKAATGVTYQVKFTSVTAAQSFVIQFCDDTPLIGQTCNAPAGLTVAGATTGTSGVTITNKATANKIVLESTGLGTPGVQTIDIAGITNPSAAGNLYARIVTYDNTGASALTQYTTTALGADAKDEGSVALSITDSIGVTGDVLETMSFCVSGADTIAAGCASGATPPTLEIGELTGSVRALTGVVSTASVYTQISTNAVGGAVVSLKSNTIGCGGLSRLGATDFAAGCDIAAAGTTGTVDDGEAMIGVKGATATDQGTGTGAFVTTGSYNTSDYHLNYVAGDGTGVTSTYGDPFLSTSSAPASNKEMALTFGASISPDTPAGRYTAQYSLIATGTF